MTWQGCVASGLPAETRTARPRRIGSDVDGAIAVSSIRTAKRPMGAFGLAIVAVGISSTSMRDMVIPAAVI